MRAPNQTLKICLAKSCSFIATAAPLPARSVCVMTTSTHLGGGLQQGVYPGLLLLLSICVRVLCANAVQGVSESNAIFASLFSALLIVPFLFLLTHPEWRLRERGNHLQARAGRVR